MIIIPEYLPLEATGRGRSGGISSFRGNSDDDKSKLFRRREEPTEVVEEGIPDAGLGSMSNPELFSLVPRELINERPPGVRAGAERTHGFPLNPAVKEYLEKNIIDPFIAENVPSRKPTASEDLIQNRISPDALDVSAFDKMLSLENKPEEESLRNYRSEMAALSGDKNPFTNAQFLKVNAEHLGDLVPNLPEDTDNDDDSEAARKKETDALEAKKRAEEAEAKKLAEEARKKEKSDEDPQTAAQKLIAGLAGNKGDSKQLIADYKQEYMDLIPEYEGKTESEKGMDLMKFGLLIAAQDSPNALKNVSKAFVAMGDTFTKDAAEKREWKRNVAVTAATYALDRRKEDRARDLEITLANISELGDLQVARQTTRAATATKDLDLLRASMTEGDITRKEANEQLKGYQAEIENYNKADNAHKLVLRIAQLSRGEKDGQTLGLKGVFNRVMYNAGAALDGIVQNPDGKSLAFSGEARENSQLRKAALDNLAAKMASVILGESGKTISDRDRQLVREMLGDIQSLSGVFVSEAAIKARLEQLESSLLQEMRTASASIDGFEDSWRGAQIIGTRGVVRDEGSGILLPGEGTLYSDLYLPLKDKVMVTGVGGEEGDLVSERGRRQTLLGGEGGFESEKGVYNYANLPEGMSLADALRGRG